MCCVEVGPLLIYFNDVARFYLNGHVNSKKYQIAAGRQSHINTQGDFNLKPSLDPYNFGRRNKFKHV